MPIHERSEGRDAGYDHGYAACPCFWGTKPADYLTALVAKIGPRLECRRVLDLGCGEGKNAAFCDQLGAIVTGVDCSGIAIRKAEERHPSVNWVCSDIRDFTPDVADFDIVICTGAIHCFPSLAEIAPFISKVIGLTVSGGYNVISSLNDGPQDLSGHRATFKPIFPAHDYLLSLYAGHNVLAHSTVQQEDIHPDLNIAHHHSISRLLIQII